MAPRASSSRPLPARAGLPPARRTGMAATAAVRTTCPYCGVGCGVLATPDGKGGASIKGDPQHPANAGRLLSLIHI